MEAASKTAGNGWNRARGEKGFTLVELLAVIVILGVIAAIAVPSISGIIADSKAKADAQSETLAKEAALLYLNTTDAAITVETVLITTLVTSGYLREAPKAQSGDSIGKAMASVSVDFEGGWKATGVVYAP